MVEYGEAVAAGTHKPHMCVNGADIVGGMLVRCWEGESYLKGLRPLSWQYVPRQQRIAAAGASMVEYGEAVAAGMHKPHTCVNYMWGRDGWWNAGEMLGGRKLPQGAPAAVMAIQHMLKLNFRGPHAQATAWPS